jgi:methanogenic corrinoid protein MtbC1
MADLEALKAAIVSGHRQPAVDYTRAAIADGVGPAVILDAMTAAMEQVGAQFQRNEIYVPEMLIAARAMKESMAILEPELTAAGLRPEITAVIGTVKGDLHDIGKNLVAMMWRGANINVVDLGTDVSGEMFASAVKQHGARLVGISSLLTTTMIGMRDVIATIRSADLRDVKVVIGGAPVTSEFANEVGADGYAPDAAAAVDVATRLMAS